MSGRLQQLLADLGDSPHKIGGIPPGIISGDDFDVTDAAFATLARASDMARLLIDMGEALARVEPELVPNHDAVQHIAAKLGLGDPGQTSIVADIRALLARLDTLGNDTA